MSNKLVRESSKKSFPSPVIKSPASLAQDQPDNRRKSFGQGFKPQNIYEPFNHLREDTNKRLHEFNIALQEAFQTKTVAEKIAHSQDKLRQFLEDPSSSFASMVANVILSILILFSTIAMILESVEYLYFASPTLWFFVDLVLTSIFTVEIFLRLWAYATSFKAFFSYVFSIFFLIDIIAVMPFYLEMGLYHQENMHFMRLTGLRLIRVFSLLKMFRFIDQIRYIQISFEIAGEAVRKSLGPLFPLFAAGAVLVLFLATVIFYCERGQFDDQTREWINSKGEISKFNDIPETIWFVVTTITTTGYGDMAPTTFWGRFFTFVTMICGMLLIALPSIIIGRNFSILWGNLKARNQIPPPPVWMLKLTGSETANYQKLGGQDDTDEFKEKEMEMAPIKEKKKHGGVDLADISKSAHVTDSAASNLTKIPELTEQDGKIITCPSCKARFKETIHHRNPASPRKSQSHHLHSSKLATVIHDENGSIVLDTGMTEIELLRIILAEVQKNGTKVQELLNQNNFDDEILLSRPDELDE